MAQNASFSRRGFLAASGATLAASTAVAVPAALAHAAEPDPDAELLALVEEWKEARAHYDRAAKAYNEAERRYYATRPDFPEDCKRQPGDPALNLCAKSRVGKPYDRSDIEELRAHGRMRAFNEMLTTEERARLGFPAGIEAIHRLEPSPEAQARAEDILLAWDRYHADVQRAKEDSGIDAAEEAHSTALEAADAILADIARVRAHSLKGMLIKAQLAEFDPASKSGLESDLEDAIERKSNPPELLGRSLIIDLLRMNGGHA